MAAAQTKVGYFDDDSFSMFLDEHVLWLQVPMYDLWAVRVQEQYTPDSLDGDKKPVLNATMLFAAPVALEVSVTQLHDDR